MFVDARQSLRSSHGDSICTMERGQCCISGLPVSGAWAGHHSPDQSHRLLTGVGTPVFAKTLTWREYQWILSNMLISVWSTGPSESHCPWCADRVPPAVSQGLWLRRGSWSVVGESQGSRSEIGKSLGSWSGSERMRGPGQEWRLKMREKSPNTQEVRCRASLTIWNKSLNARPMSMYYMNMRQPELNTKETPPWTLPLFSVSNRQEPQAPRVTGQELLVYVKTQPQMSRL